MELVCLIQARGIETHPVVGYGNQIAGGLFRGAYRDGTPPLPLHYSMADRVFHHGLQGQGRKEKLRDGGMERNLQVVSVPHLLQPDIMLGVLQLLGKGHQLLVLQGARIPVSTL